jgi:hypothetical protein
VIRNPLSLYVVLYNNIRNCTTRACIYDCETPLAYTGFAECSEAALFQLNTLFVVQPGLVCSCDTE